MFSLSIANATYQQNASPNEEISDFEDVRLSTLTVNADFQDVSSNMNPDIADIVGIRRHHVDIIEHIHSEDLIIQANACLDEGAADNLGVPLILPLTFSLEFEQTSASRRKPKKRSLTVCVDPLSIMLSNEDLLLVKAVTEAWTTTAKASIPPRGMRPCLFDVVFPSKRLGLGLRKDGGRIVVDNIADSAKRESISTGDSLFAINGEGILDSTTISLAEMVNRLATEPRPLCITFSREANGRDVVDAEQDPKIISIGEDHQEGIVDQIDVSLLLATVTLMEKDVPLFRGSISTAKVGCHLAHSIDKRLSLEFSSTIGIDYYNLRIWGWEPFVEPGVVFLSSSFYDAASGPKEVSVEVGDRGGGLSVNITDSLVETFSKLLDWREEIVDGKDLDDMLISDALESSDSSALTFAARRDIVTRNAANVAFRFATRQKNDTAKPFLFRNKTGLSVAFVKQTQRDVQDDGISNRSFQAVGDYSGLQNFDPSKIRVVSNQEEVTFRADIISNSSRGGDNGGKLRLANFPKLTVALQETNGITADPFENLQISRPGELLFPLTFSRKHGNAFQPTHPVREWAAWLVEYVDEKTVVTLGSSIRVVSMLNQPVELGVEVGIGQRNVDENPNVTTIGTLRHGSPFCLPLWIAMQHDDWRCSVRLASGYRFSPLFIVSPDGSAKLESTFSSCLECRHKREDTPSAWLAVSLHEDDGILTVTIDCSVSIRNLLPSNIDWEIAELSSLGDTLLDGSSVREKSAASSQPLKSGEQAEIFAREWQSLKIRLRPSRYEFDWSPWTSLSLHSRTKTYVDQNKNKDGSAEERDDAVTAVYASDTFGVALPLGLRLSYKPDGIEVAVYAEIWCTNCTSLDVVFGYPMHEISGKSNERDSEERESKELSVAEATLKEISSLFEGGETGESENSSNDDVKNILRAPGQVAPYIAEECFEYLEVESSTVRRRWWASENAFSWRESTTSIDRRRGKIDSHWVSIPDEISLFR